LLDSLVTREVLLQESERLGLDKDPAVQSRLAEAKRDVLVETVMQKMVAEEVSDAKVKDYDNAHKAEFRSVKASHILVATEDEAKAVKKRLKKDRDFAAVAKEVSTDPSAKQNGGDLGFFTKDQMVKPFADKAFAMKVNEISDPVKSEFGYHIIKVHEIKDPDPIETLDPQALNGVKRAVLNGRLDKLKSAAKIVTNKELLK
jgi:peptidyl-prolyl cis-trans isomerase C